MSAYARGSIWPNMATPRGAASTTPFSTRGGGDPSLFRNEESNRCSVGLRSEYHDRKQSVKQGSRSESRGVGGSAVGLPHDHQRTSIPLSRTKLTSGNRSSEQQSFNPSFSGQVAIDQNSNAEMSQLTMSQAFAGSQPSRLLHPASQPQHRSMNAPSFLEVAVSSSSGRSQESFFVSQSTAETRVTRSTASSKPSRSFHHSESSAVRDPRGPTMADSSALSRYGSGPVAQMYGNGPMAPAFATPSRLHNRSWMAGTMTPLKELLGMTPPREAPANSLENSVLPQGLAPIDTVMGTTPQSRFGIANKSSSSMSCSKNAHQLSSIGNGAGFQGPIETTETASIRLPPGMIETEERLRSMEATLNSKLSEQLQNLEAKERGLELKILEVNETAKSIEAKERDLEQKLLQVNDTAKTASELMNNYLSKIASEGDAWIEKLSATAKDHCASFATVVEGTLNNLTRFTDKAVAKVAVARNELFQSAFPFLTEKVKKISADLFHSTPEPNRDNPIGSHDDTGVRCPKNASLASADAIVSNESNESPAPKNATQRSTQSRRPKRVKDASLSSSSCKGETPEVQEIVSERRHATRSGLLSTTNALSIPDASPRPVTSETGEPSAQKDADNDSVMIHPSAQPSSTKRNSLGGMEAIGVGDTLRLTRELKSLELSRFAELSKRDQSSSETVANHRAFSGPTQTQKDAKGRTQTQASAPTTPKGKTVAKNVRPELSKNAGTRVTKREDPACSPRRSLDQPDGNHTVASTVGSLAANMSPRKSRDLVETPQSRPPGKDKAVGGVKRTRDVLSHSSPAPSQKGKLLSTLTKPFNDVDHAPCKAEQNVRRSKRLRTQPPEVASSKTTTTCDEPVFSRLPTIADTDVRTSLPREPKEDKKARSTKRASGTRSQPRSKTAAVQKCYLSDSQAASKCAVPTPTNESPRRPVSISESSPSLASKPQWKSQATNNVGGDKPSVRSKIVSSPLETILPASSSAKREERKPRGFAARAYREIHDSRENDIVSSVHDGTSPVTPFADNVDASVTPLPSHLHQTHLVSSKRQSRLAPALSKGSVQPPTRELLDVTNTKTVREESCRPRSSDACSRKVVAVTPNEKKRKSLPHVVSVPPKRSKTYGRKRQSAMAYTEDSYGFLS